MPGFVTAQPPRREDRNHAQPRAGASSAPSMASMARTGLSGRLERRPKGGVEPARPCPALRWKISRRAVVGIWPSLPHCRPASRSHVVSRRIIAIGTTADADQTRPDSPIRTGARNHAPRGVGARISVVALAAACLFGRAVRAGRRFGVIGTWLRGFAAGDTVCVAFASFVRAGTVATDIYPLIMRAAATRVRTSRPGKARTFDTRW
jgi:hypothetical protein